MQEIKRNLEHIKCPENEKEIILKAISAVRMNSDKPISKQVMNSIYQKLSEIVNYDD